MTSNLVIVRAGDDSLHPKWVEGCENRNFELFVSYFGSREDGMKMGSDHYESHAGLKWTRIAELFSERQSWFQSFDACWFPDDDLMIDGAGICRMFELFHARDLWLAQPALDAGSHVTHPITARVPGAELRFTSFVEIMCPIFSRSSLTRLGKTFGESHSGWGLDHVWPRILGYPRSRIAVLDSTPVVHTRAFGTGAFYQRCSELGINPHADAAKVARKYRVRRAVFHTFGSLPAAQ